MATSVAESRYANVEDFYGFRAENEVNASLRARIAAALGYDPLSTALVPEEANIGEGCGNPLLIANLAEGETVVDLGSGGGFDCFLAARKVGPTGRVIGVDMTEKMINLARKNALKANATNVAFIHSRIDSLPMDDYSADCVISNCVLNLVPEAEKGSVFEAMYRVLKPGGRIAISDFLAYKPLPQQMKDDPALQVGCVSGAVTIPGMQELLRGAGFADALLIDSKKDLNLYKETETSTSVTPCCSGETSCGPMRVAPSGRKPLDYDLNEWIGAFQIYALKAKEDGIRNVPKDIVSTERITIEAAEAP
ncbi:hypothetical protein MMC29_007050, partial [Sticta canariensis]|nr:hypothetical protein [Sticta canariensis]